MAAAISVDHPRNLFVGSWMINLLESSCQPNTVLISSTRPSPLNFDNDRRSLRGKASAVASGRPMQCIARGTAAAMRVAFCHQCLGTQVCYRLSECLRSLCR